MLLKCVPELRYKKWLNSNITCGTKTIGRIVLLLCQINQMEIEVDTKRTPGQCHHWNL
jgi:hypothetical protein